MIDLDAVAAAMMPHARQLVRHVHARDQLAARALLTSVHTIPTPVGVNPSDVLALCLADLALEPPRDLDQAAVAAAVRGERLAEQLAHPELCEAIRQLYAAGGDTRSIAEQLEMSPLQVRMHLGHHAAGRRPALAPQPGDSP